ncbi:MAG TPA: Ig-like domain-containing protein, partial [Mycobacterium sp.]|nr:Ig-like domain-containing protein [Mycobacterium sp.]
TPSLRRLAIFLVAIALVAAISPGLAVAANGIPKPVDDVITTQENEPETGNVLANDVNLGEGDLSVTEFVDLDPAFGTLTIEADGEYLFTPAVDVTGSASTTYTVANSSHEKDGNILITVTPINVAPVANDDTVTVDEDTATDVTSGLLANDADFDADTLVVSAVSNASGGTAQVAAGVVTFTPEADDCGTGAGSFDYDVSDGNGGTDTGHVTVDVTCTNDTPAAVDDTASGTEDMPATIDPADLLTNDTDVDGDTLTVTGVSNDSGGSAILDNGTITFTPDADLCLPDAAGFDYDISDGNGGTDTGHVTVDVTCVNDAPVAVDDTGSVANNPGPIDFDVLVNDTDVEGNSLSLVSASVSASAGSASVVAGKVRFTPLAAFSGSAAITYVVSDGALQDSGTLTVTVGPDTVDPAAIAPTVHFGTGRVDESAPLLISWSSSDVGSGVVAHELQVSIAGGSFTTIYSGAGTSYTKLFPFNKSLVWRVRAFDAAGNDSAWATSATRKIVPYQRNSKSIAYTGTWTNVTSAGSSGTGYAYTTTLGRRALVTFTGLEVLYVAPKTSASGYAKAYADGKLIGRFNLRASSTQLGQIITRKTWATSGSHTMRVVNDQSGRRTGLDVFVVLK